MSRAVRSAFETASCPRDPILSPSIVSTRSRSASISAAMISAGVQSSVISDSISARPAVACSILPYPPPPGVRVSRVPTQRSFFCTLTPRSAAIIFSNFWSAYSTKSTRRSFSFTVIISFTSVNNYMATCCYIEMTFAIFAKRKTLESLRGSFEIMPHSVRQLH